MSRIFAGAKETPYRRAGAPDMPLIATGYFSAKRFGRENGPAGFGSDERRLVWDQFGPTSISSRQDSLSRKDALVHAARRFRVVPIGHCGPSPGHAGSFDAPLPRAPK
jgi:hypothetical protein